MSLQVLPLMYLVSKKGKNKIKGTEKIKHYKEVFMKWKAGQKIEKYTLSKMHQNIENFSGPSKSLKNFSKN